MQNSSFSPAVVIGNVIFNVMSFIETLDVSIRVVSGIAAIILSVFGVISYLSKIKVQKIDAQIREQQLYDIIESNRRKHSKEKTDEDQEQS